ncbi:MAG: hypothetical protein WBX37_16980, partial [Pseudolabrys sp.]
GFCGEIEDTAVVINVSAQMRVVPKAFIYSEGRFKAWLPSAGDCRCLVGGRGRSCERWRL